MTTLRPFIELLRGKRWLVLVTGALSVLQSLLLLPVALLVKRIIDNAREGGSRGAILAASAAMLALYLASGLAGLANRYLVLKTVKGVIADLRAQLVRRMYALSASQVDTSDAAALHAVIVQDSARLDDAAGQTLSVIAPAAVVTLGLTAVALVLDPLLTGVLLLSVPVSIVLIRLAGSSISAAIQRWHDDFDDFSRDVTDGVRRLSLSRVLATTQRDIATTLETVRRVQQSGTQTAWQVGARNVLNGLVAAFAGVAVLAVGALEVIDGKLTIGELLSFYAIAVFLMRNIGALLSAMPVLATGAPSLANIRELLATPLDLPYSGEREFVFRGEIELRDVRFGYDDSELLHGVDLHLRAGERVALIGPNGAGKSTLARLVLGLYRPSSGKLLADGVPYDELDMTCLHVGIGVLFQDQVLHRGTLADVIRAGRPATDEAVRQAAHDAGAEQFIGELDEGYDTVAGEAAKLLSGGQRQRLALARAFLNRPALLLLDEPTTHLDDEGVEQLVQLLAALPQQPTVVMITHDLGLARRADRVVEVRDGRARVGLQL